LQPSRQAARACGESAKQATTNGMKRSASTGEWLLEFRNCGVVVFICGEDRKSLALLSSTLLEALAISAAVSTLRRCAKPHFVLPFFQPVILSKHASARRYPAFCLP